MIVIALGANLPSPAGPPRATLEAALARLVEVEVAVVRRSSWYRTAPVPTSDQPWFVNGVAVVETARGPEALLALLLATERAFGRRRGARWAARTLDLDLIDHHGAVRAGPEPPILPHPRLGERAFVLAPLAEVAPGWRHPLSGLSAAALLARLPDPEPITRLE